MAKKLILGPQTARKTVEFFNRPEKRVQMSAATKLLDINPNRTVRVINNSSETVPAYGCMRVTGVDLVSGQYYVTIDKPNGTGGRFLFNGFAPILAGEKGVGYSDVVLAYVSGTPSLGSEWGPDSDWFIESGGTAVIDVWGEIETGLAYGRLIQDAGSGGSTLRFAKTNEEIAADSSGEITFWNENDPPTVTSPAETATAYLHWMHGDQAVSSGKEVLVVQLQGLWHIIGAECEGDPLQFNNNQFTLDSTDITNGYVDLTSAPVSIENVFIAIENLGVSMSPGTDFTLSTDRITWDTGIWGPSGETPLASGDVLSVRWV